MAKRPKKPDPVPNLLLRRAREAREWRQHDLAEMMQVGESTIRSWESGRNVPLPSLAAKLCQIFGMSPEQLGLPTPPSFLPLSFESPTGALVRPDVSLLEGEIPSDAPEAGVMSPTMEHVTQMRPFLFSRKADRSRRTLLARVRKNWLDEEILHVLGHSAFIRLDLVECPQALAHPRFPLAQHVELAALPLPAGTLLRQLYDSTGDVLLLGERGAGKTTLLSGLLLDLLVCAEQHEDAAIPVVFHLASWSGKHASLAEWLVEVLVEDYLMTEKVAQIWVETDGLIVLLDGLDKVPETLRQDCVKGINAYQNEHSEAPC